MGYAGQRNDSHPGQDNARFHHVIHKSMQFKTYKLLISENFHLIFLNHSSAQVTETTESKTTDKEGPLYTSHRLRKKTCRTCILHE